MIRVQCTIITVVCISDVGVKRHTTHVCSPLVFIFNSSIDYRGCLTAYFVISVIIHHTEAIFVLLFRHLLLSFQSCYPLLEGGAVCLDLLDDVFLAFTDISSELVDSSNAGQCYTS